MANEGLPGVARKRRFVETIQPDLPCPVPFAKIFRFAADPNQIYIAYCPTPLEGRIAIVTDAGLDAVDAAASGTQRESQGELNLVSDKAACGRQMVFRGRQSRVVLAPLAGVKFAEARRAR